MAKSSKKDGSLESILEQYSSKKTYDFIPTGSLNLDALLGGGVALGSCYAIWGPSGSGKSTVAFQILKQFCKNSMQCAFIDVERAFTIQQQKAFGLQEYVESGMLTVLEVDSYQECYDVCKALAFSDKYKLVVIDSETELGISTPDDVDVTSMQPGQKSRQSASVLSAAKKMFAEHDVANIWICHARANIDMSAGPYAPKEKQAGGYGIRHTPDAIIKVSAGQKLKETDEIIGQILHIVADKNKFVRPFVNRDVKLFFGKGILKKVELVDLALEFGIITQNGAYFLLPDGTSIRGRDTLYDLSTEQCQSIKSSVVNSLQSKFEANA